MRRSSGIKSDIAKIKKLQALQEKATDKLNKITAKAAGKTLKKKTAKAVVKKKAGTTVKKKILRFKILRKKSRTPKKSSAPKTGNKRQSKKRTGSRPSTKLGVKEKEGFIFRHFGRG